MKKLLTILGISLLFVSISVSTAFAEIIYNEATNTYISTSEEDGVLCVGGTVYKDEDTMYGLSLEDGLYLENIVPTDENILNEPDVAITNKLNSPIQSKNIKQDSTSSVYTYNYTPENSRFVFKWDAADRSNVSTVNIEIVNINTGETIARGYNLDPDQSYKTIVDVTNTPLKLMLTSNSPQKGEAELTMSSTNSKEAEASELDFTQSISDPILLRMETGLVPVNIDGNQGKKLDSYKMVGSGVHYLKTTFSSSTNNMATINIRYDIAGVNMGYTMNLALKSYFMPVVSFGTGTTIDIILSTNSNSGKATLNYVEAGY